MHPCEAAEGGGSDSCSDPVAHSCGRRQGHLAAAGAALAAVLLLRWLPVVLISIGNLLPAFASTPLPLPTYEGLTSGRGDY